MPTIKNLADLKRALVPGVKLTHTFREDTVVDYDGNREVKPVPIPPKLAGKRTITHADTTGIYLSKTPEDGIRGSFLGFPKAKDLVIDSATNSFTVIDRTQSGEIWLKMTYQFTS